MLANARPIDAFAAHCIRDAGLVVVESNRGPTNGPERRLQLFEQFDVGDDPKPAGRTSNRIAGGTVLHELVGGDRHQQDLVSHLRFDRSDLESEVERGVGRRGGRIVGSFHRSDRLDPRCDTVSHERRIDLEHGQTDIVPGLRANVDDCIDGDGLVHGGTRDRRGRNPIGDGGEPVSNRIEIPKSVLITKHDLDVTTPFEPGRKPPTGRIRSVHLEFDGVFPGDRDRPHDECGIDRTGRGPFDRDGAFEDEVELQIGALEHRLSQP